MDLPLTDGELPEMRHPAVGPQRTVTSTPALRPGAVRRTTSIDVSRPRGFGGGADLVLRGRDVRADAPGRATVLDEVEVRLGVDEASGLITAATVDGGSTPPVELTGLSVRRGWGKALAAVLAPERSLLFSLLEDLGGAFLVSGYAPLRAGAIGMSGAEGARLAEAQADICAGWARGGEIVTVLARTGKNAVPIGPSASPALLANGWHEVDELTPEAVRRIRRLDVGRAADGLRVEAHFRDTYAAEDAEMVMHEYLVDVEVDAAGAVARIEVDPRVLPWAPCPSAVGSAHQVVGVPLAELPALARAQLRGPSTCTHLTSTLRSLADAPWLAEALDEPTVR
jgi:hypothetical protein